jgi:hypothetical protein
MLNRIIAVSAALLSAAVVIATPAAPARAGDDSGMGRDYYSGLSCGRLWYERNRIYARYGYCFKSARAIATFGRGCFSPFGRVPGHQRRVINHIQRIERYKGC